MATVPRVNTAELILKNDEGDVLAGRDVQIFVVDTYPLAPIEADIFVSALGPTTDVQPLKTDSKGRVRLASLADAWVDAWTYTVVTSGADPYQWEATSGRASYPAGPAGGDLANEYPDPTIDPSFGGGGGGGEPLLASHAALKEGMHGFPATMLDGNTPIWNNTTNTWDQYDLDALDVLKGQMPKINLGGANRAAGAWSLADAGKRLVQGNGAITITLPQDSTLNFPIDTFFEATRSDTPSLTIAGELAGMLQTRLSTSLLDSVTVPMRWGQATILKTASNRYLVGGDIA